MFHAATRIDKSGPLPRHAQVKQILRDLVTSGQLRPGDKIPAEVDIACRLGVSKMTANKAILALTSEGFFTREVGRGTFVASRLSATALPPREPAARTSAGLHSRITLSFVPGSVNIMENDYYGALYRSIREALGARAAELDIYLADADYSSRERRIATDGWLIIAPRAESIEAIEAFWAAGKAVVAIGASWLSLGVPSVDSDNVGGAMKAVRHLADLGHRRIALLYAEEETANTQDRIVGYRRGLGIAGLPYSAAWEVRSQRAWQAGVEAKARLTELFRDPEPITAVFAAGYYLALEAMNAVRSAGLQVPEDVSVVGFDDPLSAQLVYPPLTTVRQPLYEMGRRAAERLLRLLEDKEPRSVVREILPAQLITRSSAVSAPAARTK